MGKTGQGRLETKSPNGILEKTNPAIDLEGAVHDLSFDLLPEDF
jgi:hypothetical protein